MTTILVAGPVLVSPAYAQDGAAETPAASSDAAEAETKAAEEAAAAEAEAKAAEEAAKAAEAEAKAAAEAEAKAAEEAEKAALEAKVAEEAKKAAAEAEAAEAEARATVSQPEAKDEKKDVENILVTGSRVKRLDLTTPAPVAIIDRQTIDNSGLASIGQILQNLPSQSNAINVQANNGGDGSTRINLRGIGTARTLVLLNGRRLPPGGTGANASVDLNMIPIEIIERIEVLKDGSSAIYGSDAIAGVVNIITKKNFDGVEASVYTGSSQHGGPIYQASVTAGQSTDKASFLLSFQFYEQKDLLSGKRDFSKSDLDFDFDYGQESTLGSSAPPEGNIFDYGEDGPGNGAWQDLVDRTGDYGAYHNDPADGWRAASFTGNSDVGEGDYYNYQPENYLVTPSRRYSLYGQANYQVTDHVELYFEGLYANRQSDQLLAPEPLFTIVEGLTVSADNVYNPFGRDFIDVRRRLVEFGNRRFYQDLNTYRAALGVRGDLPDGLGVFSTWDWDASFVYGRTEGTSVNEGRLVLPRLQSALGPSYFDDAGIARCGTPGAPVDGCVPLNLFGGAGSITPDMVDYLTYTGTARGFSENRIFSASAGGEIFELWGRPASVAIGFQHRREAGGDEPDPYTASGETTGNKGEPTSGSYAETAGFMELDVPVLADLPGVEVLEVNAAMRLFDFNTFGTDFMWKLGGLWKVYSDVTIRSTYSRAFRAPSVSELFSGTSDSFPSATDPCDTSDGPLSDTVRAQCDREGVPLDHTPGQTQLRSLVGGNPLLGPETANTLTAGMVWTPSFSEELAGLSLTLDYFNISVDKAIQSTGVNVILDNCYNKPDGERSNCDQIVRDSNGIITLINDTQQNVGGLDTSGLDIALNYARSFSFGRIGFRANGTWLHKYTVTLPDGTPVKGLGVYDLGVYPDFRGNATIQWAKDGLGAGMNFRYISNFKECQDDACSEADDDSVPARTVSSNTRVDLFASYGFSNPAGYTRIQAGINNIADNTPPKIYNGFLANSDSNNYDYLGRYFYIGLNHKM